MIIKSVRELSKQWFLGPVHTKMIWSQVIGSDCGCERTKNCTEDDELASQGHVDTRETQMCSSKGLKDNPVNFVACIQNDKPLKHG